MVQMSIESPALNWRIRFFSSASEAEWETLYAEELPRVYNFFRYRVGNEALAEDLTSMTFEKAWRARQRYRRDLASFSTWLFTIARNIATDHFRQRRTDVPLEEIGQRLDEESPEDSAIRHSEFRRLSTLLGGLPDRERELISLRYGSGLSNRAIARATGLSESNVGTILHRTILSLRAKW
jgi:RNA polymerase sigma-70 factor, ECF subfamily